MWGITRERCCLLTTVASFSLFSPPADYPQSLHRHQWHWTAASMRPNCLVTRNIKRIVQNTWSSAVSTFLTSCRHCNKVASGDGESAFPALLSIRLTFWMESGHPASPAKQTVSFPPFFPCSYTITKSLTSLLKSSYGLCDKVAQPSSFLVQGIWLFGSVFLHLPESFVPQVA